MLRPCGGQGFLAVMVECCCAVLRFPGIPCCCLRHQEEVLFFLRLLLFLEFFWMLWCEASSHFDCVVELSRRAFSHFDHKMKLSRERVPTFILSTSRSRPVTWSLVSWLAGPCFFLASSFFGLLISWFVCFLFLLVSWLLVFGFLGFFGFSASCLASWFAGLAPLKRKHRPPEPLTLNPKL